MKLFRLLSIFIILSLGFSYNSFATIDFSISPIKYEIDIAPGNSIIKTARLRNNSTGAVVIYTGKSDFEANGNGGMPRFIRHSELVYTDQQMSTWITIDTSQFTIEPKTEKIVQFQINIPNDATPGGHYGAIFFKNPNSENASGSGNIGVNVDYGILILLNVAGDITSTGSVGPIVIDNNNGGSGGGGGWGGGYSNIEIDNCPYGDLTASTYDNKCIDNPFDNRSNSGSNNQNINENINDDFKVGFEIPFKNEGNTHIKLIGNIILTDEDGNQIKGIGRESIKNEDGAVIGEKIVDYIPINDNGGNTLPGTERKYQCDWEGFPYETRDERGKSIIKNWTPSKYYTDLNTKQGGFLMPWERISKRIQNKKITADFNISYINEKGEEVLLNSAKEFYIDYTEEYIGLNPYFIIGFGFFLFLILMWIIVKIKNRRRCLNKKCKKKIKKDMLICPYCGTNQKDEIFLKNKKDSKKNLKEIPVKKKTSHKVKKGTKKKIETKKNTTKKKPNKK